MNNNYYLYKHTNKVNGKVYIGITSQKPEQRWSNGSGYSTQHFSRAIKKYGWDGFKHEVLYSNLSEIQAKVLEVSLIHYYKSTNPKYGYNVSEGGDIISEETKVKLSKAHKGKVLSEETKAKLSKAHKGKIISEEQKAKLSEANKGKRHSEETKAKISEANKGKVRTEETRKKLSEINKGHIVSKDTRKKISEAMKDKTGFKNPKSKSCICLTTGFAFGSTCEAERYYKISHIRSCCRGERKSAGKFNGEKLRWKYIEDLKKPKLSYEDKQHLKDMLNKYYYKIQ